VVFRAASARETRRVGSNQLSPTRPLRRESDGRTVETNVNPVNDRLHGLTENRERFLSFVRARVHDRIIAEDILQAAYARALEKAAAVQSDRLVAWFYRVLRNAITDQHRRAAADARGRERMEQDPTMTQVPAPPRNICGCVRRALTALKPAYRTILQSVEVDGQLSTRFAQEHGISAGNAAVRLHRARRLLAAQLRSICGTCTLDGCADCDCGHGSGGLKSHL
jgi:RNA polymerase sigma factor (sigma-70 family)